MHACRALRFLWILAMAGAVAAGPAAAQCASGNTRPRVLVLVDTSGSMTYHFVDSISTGGDGSTVYTDALMTRGLTQAPGFGLYPGYQLSGPVCPPASPPTALTAYDGVNSRMYAAKTAVTNLVNASGSVDWGLMRYSGTTCPVINTKTNTGGTCTSDAGCASGAFCLSGQCATDNNLCSTSALYDQACHRTNQTTLTYGGTCGTSAAAGNVSCASPQVCYADADCTGATSGQCAPLSGSAASSCQCGSSSACPTGYTCTGGRCVYNLACQSVGGAVLVDPSTTSRGAPVLPYVDGIEALPGNLLGLAENPELRAAGNTPLAGAARSATAWYNNIKLNNLDAKILCRPYVLVLITDGYDTCDADTTKGPVAAASGFVGATVSGARVLNKVYVIGLAFGGSSNPTLDTVAKAGGTGSARLASNQADIQAALADIVQSSVLTEKCNNADEDCDGTCDEPFPDVAVTNLQCSNRRSARSCDNGATPGTHCYATGTYVCSADQLSETCGAPTCQSNSALCPTSESPGGCNGIDDDCNGVVDDCTPNVARSCCSR
jgi:hypothetical protein